jgi:nuclear protein localization family protein 4
LYGTKTKRKKEKTEEEKEKSKDASSKKKENDEEGKEDEMITELFADVIYEPNQNGNAYVAHVDEEDEESQTAEAIANAMGYERIGCVFSQSDVDRGDESVSAMSAHEVTLCAKLQAKYGKEFVTVIVVQFEDEDEEMQVTFEAFQVSDQCVKLYEDGFFELDEKTGVAKLPASSSAGIAKEEKEEEEGSFSNWGSHTKLVKPVMVERKDVTEVDNDFWIVAVPIKDHTGTAQSGFPIENRLHPPQTADDIRSAIQSRSATCSSYAEKLRDFHLLLFLSKQMDKNDVLAIAESTNDYIDGGDVSEGYKVLIDAIAGIA